MWSTRLICSPSIPSKWKGTATDSEISFPSEAKFVCLFVRHSLTVPNIIKISWLQLKTKAACRYLSQCSFVYWKYFVHPSFANPLHDFVRQCFLHVDMVTQERQTKEGLVFPSTRPQRKHRLLLDMGLIITRGRFLPLNLPKTGTKTSCWISWRR